MPKTNIRSKALDWFAKNHPKETGEIYASKFYTPEESWSKTSVCFFLCATASNICSAYDKHQSSM